MALTTVAIKDPYSLGLPEIFTGGDMNFVGSRPGTALDCILQHQVLPLHESMENSFDSLACASGTFDSAI